MRHYHLNEALKRAREAGFDVQRNHNSNGRTEVVVAYRDWEIVWRNTYTSGNANGQACFINYAIKRIESMIQIEYPGVLYQSERGYPFAVISEMSFVWDRHLKLWQRAISSVHHIESTMNRMADVKIRRTKMYWPEELS